MPISTATTFEIVCYTSPSSFPSSLWEAMEANQLNSNIILPHAQKCLKAEKRGEDIGNQTWIVCSTRSSIDFVLACTEGGLGTYPIFIFATSPVDELYNPSFVNPRIKDLALQLSTQVPKSRVFSIFAPESITYSFAEAWSNLTGVQLAKKPVYYHATFTYCTRRSVFPPRSMTVMPGLAFRLRLAEPRDIPHVAPLSQQFSATSPPFVLSAEAALLETEALIRDRQLWVHEVRENGGEPEIASIVASTRTSEKVAGITKVYTNPLWRKKGCAERLVRMVTRELLKTKERVVLYVGLGNSAANVYARVGFAGLKDTTIPVEGVDTWLELGFDTDVVELGHW
ncbi:hypothetical protein JAAARDRAFT_120503 [Jaapia argillacea MUCL 33604]|uniref:N-acetyltransferase domain-containing protein n=1 Tax=Jaapia argillacea MUCL 33604 TaxID=933084 RepID=A0A067Q829_9AGAM|nr:hypothetical protein JAAARDRAFT_120503 [Jaapia argillacea MUCL 33604]